MRGNSFSVFYNHISPFPVPKANIQPRDQITKVVTITYIIIKALESARHAVD